jgi:hypothetical protein
MKYTVFRRIFLHKILGNFFSVTIYFEGGSVSTRSRTVPKKTGADYSANAG